MSVAELPHPEGLGASQAMSMSAFVRGNAGRLKIASVILLIVALMMFVKSLPVDEWVEALKVWVERMGVWGPLIFAAIYAVWTVLFLPGSFLTLAGGAVFGIGWGTATVSLGSTTGAALAFLIARYLAREQIETRTAGSPKFRAIDAAIGQQGWKIVALLRLSPAVPFNLSNYFYGLTAVRFWPYVLASWIAMLPGTVLYVYLGYVARKGVEVAAGAQQSGSIGGKIMLGVGLLATVVVTVFVTRIARRAIQQQTTIDGDSATEATPPVESTPNATPQATGFPLGVTALFISSLLLSIGATCYANLDSIRNLFGPPAATLHEAYASTGGAAAYDHKLFDDVLRSHVDERGFVDYAAIAKNPQALDRYIAALAKADFEALSRDEKLALLINAYNAFTIRLILDHWDGGKLASIKDIDGAWDQRRWKLAGRTLSLNQIEHEEIRPKFKEPRVHFALVCAAIGCPKLRNEAYVGSRIEAQLADQARYIHTHKRWFRYQPGGASVGLTQLYAWYGGDFVQVSGSVLTFAARYSSELKKALDAGREPTIRWLEYDWKLNDKRNAK